MADNDQFFNNVFGSNDNGEYLESLREQRQLAYEDRIVRRVFRECGVKIVSMGKLVNECKDMTGQPRLSFQWFNTSGSFPGWLCGRRIPRLHELTLAEILKPAMKNRLFKAVVKNLHRQEIDEKVPFAFVFPVVRTMFCAHTLRTEPTASQLVIVSEGSPIIIEPLSAMCQSLGNSWWG
jgi:hypothetical protein